MGKEHNQYTKKDRGVNYIENNRNIFYGEVISIDDEYEIGAIRVRINSLDTKTDDSTLPLCYPLLPKFFFVLPKVGEVVRLFIEDVQYPNKGRYWIGSIISQFHKIEYDSVYTALAGTNIGLLSPDKAPSTYPNAKGVFPEKEDIAIIGRKNTDVILSTNNVKIRAGKHIDGNPLMLNKKNTAIISLNYFKNSNDNEFTSTIISSADRIALLSSKGKINYNINLIDDQTIENIFNNGHPYVKGDILVSVLKLMRDAITQHYHPYNTIAADKSKQILDIEKINFDDTLQKNIVSN